MSTDVEAYFRRYAELYMAAEAEAVADLCEVPFLAVRGGTAIHLPDRAALVEHLAGLMAAYRRSGATAANIVEMTDLPQGDGASFVTVHWDVRAADGAQVRDFRSSYQLVGRDAALIVSYVNHDASYG